MELRAIVAGLEAIKAAAEITIYADSLYAIGAFTGNKIKKNGDLITAGLLKIEAIKAMGGTVTFQHVNGHAGDPLNERCDKLARQQTAIKKEPCPLSQPGICGTTTPDRPVRHHTGDAHDNHAWSASTKTQPLPRYRMPA